MQNINKDAFKQKLADNHHSDMAVALNNNNNKRSNSKKQQQQISAEFPFKSNYVEIHGSKIHYVDEGSGKPILSSWKSNFLISMEKHNSISNKQRKMHCS